MPTDQPARPVVGDQVVVFDVNGSRRGQPDGGWPGVVTKVGRTLVTIEYGAGRRTSAQFRIATRRVNDAYGHQWYAYGHQWYETPAEAAEKTRRQEALGVLAGIGLRPDLGRERGIPTEVLEALAEVVRGTKDPS